MSTEMSTAVKNRIDAQTGKARGPYKMNTSGTTKAVPKPANPTHVKSGTGGILAWKVRSCYLLHRVPMCVGTEHSIALFFFSQSPITEIRPGSLQEVCD